MQIRREAFSLICERAKSLFTVKFCFMLVSFWLFFFHSCQHHIIKKKKNLLLCANENHDTPFHFHFLTHFLTDLSFFFFLFRHVGIRKIIILLSHNKGFHIKIMRWNNQLSVDNFHLCYSLSEPQSALTEADLKILGFWCRESCRLRAGDEGSTPHLWEKKKKSEKRKQLFYFENTLSLSYCRENEAVLF